MQSLAENVIKYKPPILVEVRILWLINTFKAVQFRKEQSFLWQIMRTTNAENDFVT